MTGDEVIARLWNGCEDDNDFAALDRLLEQSGLRWTCHDPEGEWTNVEGEPCEQCGLTMAASREKWPA